MAQVAVSALDVVVRKYGNENMIIGGFVFDKESGEITVFGTEESKVALGTMTKSVKRKLENAKRLVSHNYMITL